MTANYIGDEKITLNDEYLAGTEEEGLPLDLEYYPNVGANRTVPEGDYFIELNRVTSDYDNQFDVTSLLQGDVSQVNVHVVTNNSTSPKFDGRIKEVKLKFAYNDTIHWVKYWVNEGHDPITKYSTSYTDNKTYFETGNLGNISKRKALR